MVFSRKRFTSYEAQSERTRRQAQRSRTPLVIRTALRLREVHSEDRAENPPQVLFHYWVAATDPTDISTSQVIVGHGGVVFGAVNGS